MQRGRRHGLPHDVKPLAGNLGKKITRQLIPPQSCHICLQRQKPGVGPNPQVPSVCVNAALKLMLQEGSISCLSAEETQAQSC